MPDLPDDHALLIEAVREAGALARVFFEGEFKTWEKYPDDPVSEADVAIDKLLHQRLYEARRPCRTPWADDHPVHHPPPSQ